MASIDQTDLAADADGPFDLADPHSPLAPYYCQTGHVVAAALLGLVFLLICTSLVRQTDIYGHLRFGEHIVGELRLPEREMFSGDFADQKAPLINFYWLGQAGAFLIFDVGRALAAPDPDHQLGGGLVLLSVVQALLVVLRLGVLLLAFRRLTGSVPFATLGTALVAFMGYLYHLTVLRPQILGELGFAIVLLALSRPVLSRRALVGIPLVLALWGNCHGSFPIAFVLLGMALVGQAVLVVWRAGLRRLVADVQVRRLALVLVVSFLAVGILNPDHFDLYRASLELSNHPNIQTMNEWRPLPLNLVGGGLMFSSLALVLVVCWLDRRNVTPFQLILLIAFGGQAFLHARMFVWWSMIVVWVLLPHWHAVWRRGLPEWMQATDTPTFRKTILAVLTPVVLFLWTPASFWLCFGEAPVGSKRVHRDTPLAAAAYLRQQYERDPSLKRCIFTSETVGEYLLWDLRLDPPVRITAYTHVHLLTPEHWALCLIVKNAAPGWEQFLEQWGVQFLVVEPAKWHAHLIEEIRAAPDRWQVIPDMGGLFVAKYLGTRP